MRPGPELGPGAPLVSVQGVAKVFRRHGRAIKALADVNLSVNEGEFVSLLGPSGCGKSTLLNIIAGILPYAAPAPTGACCSKAPCCSAG